MTEQKITGSFQSWSVLLRNLSLAATPTQQTSLLSSWWTEANVEDRFSAIRLMAGDAPKKLVTKKALLQWHAERSPLPIWLQEECHAAAPDPCEAIALLEDAGDRQHNISLDQILSTLRNATRYSAEQKASIILQHWDILDREALYQFNRLVTGSSTINLPRNIWIPAIASLMGVPPHALAHQLEQQTWVDEGYAALAEIQIDQAILPHPFPEKQAIEHGEFPEEPGLCATWSIAGREVQLIKRNGKTVFWGTDLDERFDQQDELIASADRLPEGTVLYGQLVPSNTTGGKDTFHVLDVWEWSGLVPESTSAAVRRELMKELLAQDPELPFRIAQDLAFNDLSELRLIHRKCRLHGAHGMLLSKTGVPGTPGPSWWHWPAAPHRLKAVLLYVQRGDGSQGPQYSFGLARGRDWVTIARTGEGLTQEERDAIDAFTKTNTLQRFGPVRTVKAVQVMELEVDSIRSSSRHKSGYLLEGVRIAAWRKDLGTEMADDIGMLNSMIDQ